MSVMLSRCVQTVVSCRCARTAASWRSITQRISSPLVEHLIQCESAQLHERFHQNVTQKLDIADNFFVYNIPAAALYTVWLQSCRSSNTSTCGEVQLLRACRLCTLQVVIGAPFGTVLSKCHKICEQILQQVCL